MSFISKPVTPRVLVILVLLGILVAVGSSLAIKGASAAIKEATSAEAITQQSDDQPAYTKKVTQTLNATLGARGVITSGTVETTTEIITHVDTEALGGSNARTASL